MPPTPPTPRKTATATVPSGQSEPHQRINRIIKILLAAQGSNQRRLAEALGINESTISKSLRGDRSWRVEDLETMAEFFEVEPAIWFADPTVISDRLVEAEVVSARRQRGLALPNPPPPT